MRICGVRQEKIQQIKFLEKKDEGKPFIVHR
jgi:hypothetical protein